MENYNRFNYTARRVIGIVLIVAGLVAIAVGIWQEEAQIVLQKATLICLECIGLG